MLSFQIWYVKIRWATFSDYGFGKIKFSATLSDYGMENKVGYIIK